MRPFSIYLRRRSALLIPLILYSLPRNTPGLNQLIDSTLRSLGLQDVAGNRIGTPLQRGVSGGQRRRVTIACSVVARPRVLVLDEPTSGLDSASSQEVISSREYGSLASFDPSLTFLMDHSQASGRRDQHRHRGHHSPARLRHLGPL